MPELAGLREWQSGAELGGLWVRRTISEKAVGNLLYIHGLGESGACFESVADHPDLRSWNHWVPDLPGYGRSPKPNPPLSLADQARRLAIWAQRVGILPAVLVGHSMGGVVGQLLCEGAPQAVQGFVNVEGNISAEDCAYSGQAVLQKRQEFVEGGFEGFLKPIRQQAESDPAHAGYLVSLQLCDPASLYENSRELVDLSRDAGLASRLQSLQSRIPLVYIAGSPGGACRRTVELLIDLEVSLKLVLPSGHWPFVDCPDEFCQALSDFLQSLQ